MTSTVSSNSSRVEQHRQRIVKAVLALYDNQLAGEPTPCDVSQPASQRSIGLPTDVDEVWSPEVTFNDPLMKVTGWQHYRAQFAYLHDLFPTITMQVYSVSWGHGSGKLTSAGDIQPPKSQAPDDSTWEHCIIDARCTYSGKWVSVPVRQTTHLRLTKEANGLGRIIAHEDTWNFADLIRGVPLIGRLYNWSQPRMGAFVSERILGRYAKQADIDSADKNLSTNTLHAVYHPVEAERVGKMGAHKKGAGAFVLSKSGEEKKAQSYSTGGEKKEL